MDDLSRRGLIAGAAASAVVAGVAACSPASTQPSPGSTAGSGSAASGSATSGSAVTVKPADVPVGGGTILSDANYVVTQPTAGTYKAFSKTCTHEGCPVSKIVGTDIVCTCHNSRFSIVDGSVTQPPARKPLPAAKVTLQGGVLIIGG